MNRKIEIIDKILESYIASGSSYETISEIRPIVIDLASKFKDQTPSESIEDIIIALEEATQKFLNTKNNKDINMIYGISSSILACGEKDWNILLYGGKTNFDRMHDIEEDTPFDVASITKLYTLILKDKLVEYGYFQDDSQITTLTKKFPNLTDWTLEDLSLLCGELRTPQRLDNVTKKEALKILRQIYPYSKDKTINKYSDFQAIITAMIITETYNKINGKNLKYEQIFKIMFSQFDMPNTMYNPKKDIIAAGCGNNENIVHDPKTRILDGVSGAAGLFTTSKDQMEFAKALFKGNTEEYDFINNPVSPENIKKYATAPFPNSVQCNKGHFGLYVKSPKDSFVPNAYSNSSFAHQGWTGPCIVFDPINKIQNTIFTATVRPDLVERYKNQENGTLFVKNDKPTGYMDSFDIYQDIITKNTLILKTIKEFLAKYYEDSILDIKVKIR